MSEKPLNVLWIMTDEHRTDSLGCYGNSQAQTPNIDRLAEQGVCFRNAFVQNPVCVPSRVSMLSGRYGRSTRVMTNDSILDRVGATFLPELFFRSGYQTVNIGRIDCLRRSHSQAQEGMVGFYRQHTLPDLPQNGLTRFCQQSGDSKHPMSPLGKMWNVADSLSDPRRNQRMLLYGTYPGAPEETTEAMLIDRAVDFLRTRDTTAPFFLRVSLLPPHTPVLPPAPYDRMHEPADMEMPEEEDLEDKPSWQKRYRALFAMWDLPEHDRRAYKSHYYGLVSHVDAQIGRLLQALQTAGLQDHTLIVLNSDHGTMLGDKGGLITKGPFDYDETNRVPFIFSCPGRLPEGRHVDELVELIDMAPTLLDMADLGSHAGFHGRSLLPVIQGEQPGREMVFSEGGEDDHIRLCVRTRRHKMTVFPVTREGELYDLENDPRETINLFRRQGFSAVRRELSDALAGWLRRFPAHPDGQVVTPGDLKTLCNH